MAHLECALPRCDTARCALWSAWNEAKFALLHAGILGLVPVFWHFSCHLTSPPSPYSRGYHGPFGAGAAPVRYRAVRASVGLDMRRNLRYFTPVFSVAFQSFGIFRVT